MKATKSYQLAYGKNHLTFGLPDNIKTLTIEANKTEPIKDIQTELKKALKNPIQSRPLIEIVKPGETVAILVSDITRLSFRTDGYLPVILDELNQAGVKDSDITIIITTGTHRPQTPEEDVLTVGNEAYGRVKTVNHDCHAPDLVQLGHTGRGTEIAVNRLAYEADRLILTGGVSYHLLAGFGGGRKSVAPGICSYRGIQQNHGLSLKNAGPSGINPNVAIGTMKGNPVAEDMYELTSKINPDFLVNIVVNEKKEYIAVLAGHWHDAFLAGCKVVEKAFGVPVSHQSDVVLCSCGGYPKDIQLYQSIKGLDNAGYAVRENGVIIICSECSDGTGSDDFMRWFKYANVREMREALAKDFTMPGFVALRTASIISMASVILISSLPQEAVERVGMIPASSPEQALDLARKLAGEIRTVTLMPHGTLTYPILKAQNRKTQVFSKR